MPSSSTAAYQCYSLRQCSPFMGCIQIIEADYCRALSADGQQWQIQASCETHQQVWNISDDAYIPRRYVLYGNWTKQNGFSGLPLDPMLDVPSLQHIEERLIKPLEQVLETGSPSLPFNATDNYECWLIDRHSQQPLALLASASHRNMLAHMHPAQWQANSQQSAAPNLASQPALTQEDLTLLEQTIAEQGERQQWFHRLADGRGLPIDPQSDTPPQFPEALPASAFAELLVNATRLPARQQGIFRQWVNWLSPKLLSLHGLSPDVHQHLQQQAQHQAQETSRRLATYPQPLDPEILTKIKVELKIRGL